MLNAFSASCGVCSGLLYVSDARLCRRRSRSVRWANSEHAPVRNASSRILTTGAANDFVDTENSSAPLTTVTNAKNATLFDAPSAGNGTFISHEQMQGVDERKKASRDSNEQAHGNGAVAAGLQSQQVFLVDGFGILYRSYYALVKTTMSSKDMFDTRAVYGFTNVLLSLLQKHVKGNPVIVVFEGQKKPGEVDHRTAEYPEYKSDRGPTPAGVRAAIPWVKRIVRALGLCSIEQSLFEADDVIGTLVRRAKQAGIFSVIVSVDKDFRQLLDREFVSILKPGTSSKPFEYITEDIFREDYADLHPSRYVDVLTLIGDAADSIKGVPGIGPRTAPKLIKHFGTLEGLLAAARSIEEHHSSNSESEEDKPKKKGKPKNPLEKHLSKRHAASLMYYEQRTLMMKSMVTIRDNLSLPDFSWENFYRQPVSVSEIKEIARVLEFTSPRLLTRMLRSADDVSSVFLNAPNLKAESPAVEEKTDSVEDVVNSINGASAEDILHMRNAQYEVAVDDHAIEHALSEVSTAIGMSVVFSPADSGKSVLEGISISSKAGRSVFVYCIGKKELPQALSRVLRDPGIEKVGWFMKENAKALQSTHGIFLEGKLFDIRIASDLVHAGQQVTDSSLAIKYLWNGALKRWLSQGKMKQLSHPQRAEDAQALSDLGLQAALKLKQDLAAANLERVANQVEFPLIPVLAEMEIVGVPCKEMDLVVFENDVKERLISVETELRQMISPDDDPEGMFRPTSRDDVARLLFETWKLPVKVKKSASGKYPANKKVLSLVAEDQRLPNETREFAKLMIQHREVSKILNTYTRSLINAIHPDGRIRTTFVQDASYSGRLSTSRPNMQSIPSRSPLGRKVRSTVVAADGFSILCADYSQIELRIIAALSGDVGLRAAFADGVDVHTRVAAAIFGVKAAAVTKEQRSRAKAVSYGIPYGISAHGLGQSLGIAQRDARALIDGFHAQFPAVKRFTEELVERARTDGFAQTMFGRRLPLPLLLHGGPQERRAAGRVAVNMPIQGTQADMIKLAMARIAARLRAAGARSRLILQVHDELVLEVWDGERAAVQALVEEEMENALPLPGVAVVVDVGLGESWLSAASH